MKYRGKKMQAGGTPPPRQQDFGDDIEAWQRAMDEWVASQGVMPSNQMENLMQMYNQSIDENSIERPPADAPSAPPAEVNRIQEGINRGILEAPKGYDNAQTYYDSVNEKKHPATPSNWRQNLGIGMMAIRTLGSEISGRVARGRQNQYDYLQQSALGMMNPMPTDGYQPNPYSLYAKYGGSLKKYQQGGGVPLATKNYYDRLSTIAAQTIPQPSYNMLNSWSGKPADWADSATYRNNFRRGMQVDLNSAQAMSDQALYTQFNAKDPVIQNMASNENKAINDAMVQQVQRSGEQAKLLYLPQRPQSKKPLKYGGLKHADYFGPPFSNGAKMNMTDGEKIDLSIVTRKLIPELFKFRGKKK
jgi:hypothetical protein